MPGGSPHARHAQPDIPLAEHELEDALQRRDGVVVVLDDQDASVGKAQLPVQRAWLDPLRFRSILAPPSGPRRRGSRPRWGPFRELVDCRKRARVASLQMLRTALENCLEHASGAGRRPSDSSDYRGTGHGPSSIRKGGQAVQGQSATLGVECRVPGVAAVALSNGNKGQSWTAHDELGARAWRASGPTPPISAMNGPRSPR